MIINEPIIYCASLLGALFFAGRFFYGLIKQEIWVISWTMTVVLTAILIILQLSK